MAHYAFLDKDNIVTEVIPGKDDPGVDWEVVYGEIRGQVCKRTSYNTRGGQHPEGKPFRKNYAGIGFKYDQLRDAFISPKPFPSWTLDEESCTWQSPKPYPSDGNLYHWDEYTLSWVKVNMGTS